MIILKSCGSPSWGGIEIYILRTIKELTSLGHDVSLLCLPDSNLHKNAILQGIKTLPLLSRGAGRIGAVNRLRKCLIKNDADVIHTHLSNDLWILVNAQHLSGSKAKLFLSKCMASGVNKKDLLHRTLYAKVEKIIAVSNFIKDNVLKTCPVTEEKVAVIHDAISLNEFNPDEFARKKNRTELGYKEDDVVIGMIGRMSPGKGHETFFNAVKLLKQYKACKTLKFIVVGGASFGEQEYEKKLMQLVNKLQLIDTIRFEGFQSNVQYYMQALDILAFPSNEESFGGTVAEAMAMKLPVAASNSGGVPDIVVNNETGLLVERNDPQTLAEALLRLAEDKELRKRFGLAGRKRIEEHFELTSNMKIFEKLYAGK